MTMSESLRQTTAVGCEPELSRHPLEMIPIFRRWPRSFTRDVVYTGIWNTLFAIGFTVFALWFDNRPPLLDLFRTNFVFAQCIGYPIHGLFALGDRLFPDIHRRGMLIRTIYYSALPILGVMAGYLLGTYIIGLPQFRGWLMTTRGIMSVVALSLVITAILLMIFLPRERAARAEAAMAREQAQLAAAEKEIAQARMQLLEAQIEPHFLYNTMAHVVSLVDADPATAKRMLERLIALLRSAAGGEAGGGTLQAQVDHLRAYLDILALRMGPRLTWTLDVPADIARTPIPPMLLQPVVENAIKHGLEPKVEGGTVSVVARRDGDHVVLTVADTGLGFSEQRNSNSTGLGLANLRARLATLFGTRATLTIEDNVPEGTRVTIALPVPATPK
jgi:sensor histidine kinase YesM